MLNYILRRLLLMIPTMLGIMLISFVIIQFVPGGPVERMIAQLQGHSVDATARFGGGGGGGADLAVGAGGDGGAAASKSNGIARFAPHLTGDFEGFAQKHPLKISTGAACVLSYDGGRWHIIGWNVRPQIQ